MSDVPEQMCTALATCDTMLLPDMHFFSAFDAAFDGYRNKLCEQTADTVLDASHSQEPEARVACEERTKTGMVMIARWYHQEGVCELRTDYSGGGEVSWIRQ